MDIVKAAVGHNQDNIIGPGFCDQKIDDRICIREMVGFPSAIFKVGHQFLRRKPFFGRDLIQARRVADAYDVCPVE